MSSSLETTFANDELRHLIFSNLSIFDIAKLRIVSKFFNTLEESKIISYISGSEYPNFKEIQNKNNLMYRLLEHKINPKLHQCNWCKKQIINKIFPPGCEIFEYLFSILEFYIKLSISYELPFTKGRIIRKFLSTNEPIEKFCIGPIVCDYRYTECWEHLRILMKAYESTHPIKYREFILTKTQEIDDAFNITLYDINVYGNERYTNTTNSSICGNADNEFVPRYTGGIY